MLNEKDHNFFQYLCIKKTATLVVFPSALESLRSVTTDYQRISVKIEKEKEKKEEERNG